MIKNEAINRLKEKLRKNASPIVPKFKIGDYIINVLEDKKIVAEIKNVRLYDSDFDKNKMYPQDIGEYVLLDVINEHSSRGTPDKPFYKRNRGIQAIDAHYSQVNPETARILYGKKVE